MSDTILIIDFGAQYSQLIARRIRELNVFCEIHPYNKVPEIKPSTKGIIFSGSPYSVNDINSPTVDFSKFGNIPILGLCYGAQLIANMYGGVVTPSKNREYGRAKLSKIAKDNELFEDISTESNVWMSHSDTIVSISDGFDIIASTSSVKIAGFQKRNSRIFGLQFHPEVTHTVEGKKILKNFAVNICQCSQEWTPSHFVESTVNSLKKKLGNDRVIMALSGGVDSTVAAKLIQEATGKNLFCIFVDNGLLRKNEFKQVLKSYTKLGLNIKGVDAKKSFYEALKNLTNPEEKRKAIGKTFIKIFDEQSHDISNVKWLGQGTIYPDVIESIPSGGNSTTIKSHHNVGGLPDKMKLKVVEPLDTLFKDEVRQVGRALGIDSEILSRHPFPGPGLGIRILGDVTPENVAILQEVDFIFIKKLKAHKLYDKIWQAGAMLLPIQSVGVMGDSRSYKQVVALRAVNSVDGMTADWAHLPFDFLGEVSAEIVNKVSAVNRVVYDISSKPPATIEWE